MTSSLLVYQLKIKSKCHKYQYSATVHKKYDLLALLKLFKQLMRIVFHPVTINLIANVAIQKTASCVICEWSSVYKNNSKYNLTTCHSVLPIVFFHSRTTIILCKQELRSSCKFRPTFQHDISKVEACVRAKRLGDCTMV